MKLTDICIDLEYAKKLKELGIKQSSLYMFYKDEKNKPILRIGGYPKYQIASAFTSAELLEKLPIGTEITKLNNIYYIDINTEEYGSGRGKKLCNALAKMLIYLIENKLLEVSK
jgi:hypothetical protein